MRFGVVAVLSRLNADASVVAIALVVGHTSCPSLIVLLLLIKVSLSNVSSAVGRSLCDHRLTPLHFKPIDITGFSKLLLLLLLLEFT